MSKIRKVSKYVKYTEQELDDYKDAAGSCVKKMSANFHLNFLPSGLKDFKTALQKLLLYKLIGTYDDVLEGIILDIHNVKLIGSSAAIRFDDPKLHIDISSDCYIFKPITGAIVRGTVRHVSSSQICVIIYRVFSVYIKLLNKSDVKLEVNSEIEFKIKAFNLEHMYPYIEGELVNSIESKNNLKRPKIEIEDPGEIENVVKLIEDIKKDECSDSASMSPSKPKKRKKGVTFKTEE
ncbi:DNA-directed RNA polymerase I subunit RPA43 [Eupeodes corollae]|uniref:DNA-directed RNA polymerase I subunit RPA43 n=1 Tax=Eupeodes corollae TaxID=290404 RepID=UPI002491B453|nr:DNA-directed RNA polymerase I subunit RPA43 [Eupeodes corollae]